MKTRNFEKENLGTEPVPEDFKMETSTDLIRAFNWYNYFHTSDDAKNWTLEYHPDLEEGLKPVPSWELRTIGWTCRMLSNGFVFSSEILTKHNSMLKTLIEKYEHVEEEAPPKPTPKPRAIRKDVEIRNELNNNAADAVAVLIDEYQFGNIRKNLNLKKWLSSEKIDPLASKHVLETLDELKNPKTDFLAQLVDALKENAKNYKPRFTRKRKEKSPEVLVANLQYQKEFEKIHSVDPKEIIGSKEVCLYNTEKRLITVLRGESLSVKGTTIQDWDEKISVTKKVRKPDELIPDISNTTKARMKLLVDSIRAKPQKVTGRTNPNMMILKVFR